MADVTVRDLRNRGGEVLARVQAGESLTVTKDGTPVARLLPVARRPLSGEALRARWRGLPSIDPDRFRADVDLAVDPAL